MSDRKLVVSTVATIVEIQSAARPHILTDTLVALQVAAARSPGYRSGELQVNPKNDGTVWRLVHHFENEEDASNWKLSPVRNSLLEPLNAAAPSEGLAVSHEIAKGTKTDVATAIVTEVKPGREEEYLNWQAKIQREQARFPGFTGSSLTPPSKTQPGPWTSVLRFETPAHLDAWFQSPERNSLLNERLDIVDSIKFSKVPTSFPNWFPQDAVTGDAPARWKTAALVLLGLFPTIMLEYLLLAPFLSDCRTSLRSFLMMVISVIASTFLIMPFFIKVFKWWLLPSSRNKARTDIIGTLMIAAIFALENAAFWFLIP